MLGSECTFTPFEPPLTCHRRPDEYLVTTPIPHWAFMNVTVRARIGVYGPGVSHYPQVNDTFVPETAKLIGGERIVGRVDLRSLLMFDQVSLSSARTDPRQRIRLPVRPRRSLKHNPRAPHHVSVALGFTVQPDPYADNPASSSESPSVTVTETPKSKTPAGAIAGGKPLVSLMTPSER